MQPGRQGKAEPPPEKLQLRLHPRSPTALRPRPNTYYFCTYQGVIALKPIKAYLQRHVQGCTGLSGAVEASFETWTFWGLQSVPFWGQTSVMIQVVCAQNGDFGRIKLLRRLCPKRNFLGDNLLLVINCVDCPQNGTFWGDNLLIVRISVDCTQNGTCWGEIYLL